MTGSGKHSGRDAAQQERPSAREPAGETMQHVHEVLDGLSSSVFVGLLTVDGRLTYANRAALSAVGATLEDLAGTPFEATPWWTRLPSSREKLRAAILSAASGVASRFEFSFDDIYGRQVITDFALHPGFDRDGKVAYLIPSGQDITERKHAEQALNLTRFAIDRAHIALVQIGADGRLMHVNDSACRLLGYPKETLLALPIDQLSTWVIECGWPAVWDEIKTKGSLQYEATWIHFDGHKIPVEVSTTYIKHGVTEYCFAFVADLSERKKAEKYIDFLAHYDGLTGMPNRILFQEIIAQYVSRAADEHDKAAVIIADIERFWVLNDTFGRAASDQLLQQIATRFKRHAHGQNRLARIGADQFAVVVSGVRSEVDVVRRIEKKLDECFGKPFLVGDTEIMVSARFGVSMFPEDGKDAELLLKRAEAALKRAKSTGEKYLFFTEQMTDRIAGRLALESKLRLALEREEFVLHYQPKVSFDTRGIEGVEALIRWKNPEAGLVPPVQFIPLMEETGLIVEVGAWALRKAAQDHRRWVELGLAAPRIAVNVSAMQLRKRDFVQMVQQALGQGVSAAGIDLEITESVVMDNIQENIEKLRALREMGVNISIDDFGTGYSSLAYLTKLPVQTLKIDRSFVFTLLNEPDTMTLVSAIISLAHALRLNVIAEGVETEEQAVALRAMGCNLMQGYLFGRPVPAEELIDLLAG